MTVKTFVAAHAHTNRVKLLKKIKNVSNSNQPDLNEIVLQKHLQNLYTALACSSKEWVKENVYYLKDVVNTTEINMENKTLFVCCWAPFVLLVWESYVAVVVVLRWEESLWFDTVFNRI